MGRAERKLLISTLEDHRKSKVVCYVTGDRTPIGGQIGDDAVRPLYHHLQQIGHVPKIDLFIYSRGGAIDVPWRIITALRRAADEWDILIPFRANSAATLIALGADKIVLGAHGELGPIDPSMQIKRNVSTPGGPAAIVQDQVSVEDVMAYVKFGIEKMQLKDESALMTALAKLVDRVDAVALGSIYRTHTHIRDVARQVLLSRRQPAPDDVVTGIVQKLAEQVYAHGHAIGLTAAQSMGLPVEAADTTTDRLTWQMLEDYEAELKLLSPLDPAAVVATTDVYQEDACIAAIESLAAIDRMQGQLEIRARRQMPATLNIAVNLNLQIANGAQLSPQMQQLLQQVMQQLQQQLAQQANQAAQQAVKDQAPIMSIDASFRAGVWVREA